MLIYISMKTPRIEKLQYFIFIIISFSFHSIYGQIFSDSLKQKIELVQKDSAKIKLLIEAGDKCYYTYPDTSYLYYNKALLLSKKIKNEKLQAESILSIGYYLDQKGRYKESLEYYLKAIELYESIDDQRGIANCYNYIGYSFAYLNSLDNSIKYYFKALEIFTKLNDSLGIADVNNGFGNLYYDKQNYTEAYNFYMNSFKVYEALNSKEGLLASYINIGNTIADQGNLDVGIEFYKKSIKLSKELNDLEGVAINYANLGDCYIEKGDYDLAMQYLMKSLNLSKKINYNSLLPLVYSNIAQTNLKLKKYEEAISNANISLDYSTQVAWVDVEYDAHSYLSSAYAKIGNYKKAYENHILYKKFKDSIIKVKGVEQLAKLDVIYKLDKNEKEIELLTKNEEVRTIQLKNQKTLSYFFGISSLFFISMIIILFKQRKARKKTLGLLNVEKDRAEENEALYSGIFNNSTICLYQTTPTGKILSANNAIIKMLKFDSLEDLLKRDLTKGSYVDESKRDKFKALLHEKGEITDFESEWYTKNGGIITVLEGAKVIKNTKGEIIRYDGTVQDITDKKRIQRKLIESLEKAEESDRLKSAFLANMSHEIRTPLNAIMGFSSFFKDPDLEIGKRKHFVDIINKSGDRLMKIINDIMDLSKIESDQLPLELNEVNINQTLTEIIEIHKESNQLLLNKELELKLNLPSLNEDVYLMTDENRFTQIINNLISNALKFTNSGYVEVGYNLVNKDDKSNIEFYVKDTGCGIEKDKFRLIFDRFSQAGEKDFKSGNGLGLSICKGLMNLLGGDIWLESEFGKGTTFYFNLKY